MSITVAALEWRGGGAEGGRRGRGRTLGGKNQAFGHLLRRWIHNTVNRELNFFYVNLENKVALYNLC